MSGCPLWGERLDHRTGQNSRVPLSRISWSLTVGICLIAAMLLIYGYVRLLRRAARGGPPRQAVNLRCYPSFGSRSGASAGAVFLGLEVDQHVGAAQTPADRRPGARARARARWRRAVDGTARAGRCSGGCPRAAPRSLWKPTISDAPFARSRRGSRRARRRAAPRPRARGSSGSIRTPEKTIAQATTSATIGSSTSRRSPRPAPGRQHAHRGERVGAQVRRVALERGESCTCAWR